MFEGSKPPPKRKSQDRPPVVLSPEAERQQLIEQITKSQNSIQMMNKKIAEQKNRHQKTLQSNQRNEKRLLRYRARIQEMMRYKDSPEHLLAISGYMNQTIQEYILSHNYTFTTDPHQVPDPDHMSYEQLLDLGQKIGKVSKGLSREQFQKLGHKRNKNPQDRCPICQSEFQLNEDVIELPCRHSYHEECILSWLKDENTCPICKESLVSRGKMKVEEKMEF